VKPSAETEIVQDFIQEDIIKKHMKTSKTYPSARLYSSNGVELHNDEILFLKRGDTLYLARHGEAFNFQQVMDRYEKVKKLGQGGFGKVYLMKDKEQEDFYCAMKFINLSDYM
jgi:hypothetical protein